LQKILADAFGNMGIIHRLFRNILQGKRCESEKFIRFHAASERHQFIYDHHLAGLYCQELWQHPGGEKIGSGIPVS
jgi:hypothetical protein